MGNTKEHKTAFDSSRVHEEGGVVDGQPQALSGRGGPGGGGGHIQRPVPHPNPAPTHAASPTCVAWQPLGTAAYCPAQRHWSPSPGAVRAKAVLQP